jgi:SAM-dependent methyltransferase
MANPTRQFYDAMAQDYRQIFGDWRQSVPRHGEILHKLLTLSGMSAPRHLLDCTCGIGTQAIGLAMKGYQVHGTDLSPASIEQARINAGTFTTILEPTFAVADLLDPVATWTAQYEVVISCDNAVAHFFSDEELDQAMWAMYQQLERNGLLLISLRDYDAILQNPPHTTPLYVYDDENGRRIIYQIWDWDQAFRIYNMQLFMTWQEQDLWQTRVYETRMRAIRRAEIEAALLRQGFTDISYYPVLETGYHQPILTARKP